MAAKLTSHDPLIIRPISAGVLLTATADRAVSPTLPAKAVTHTAFSIHRAPRPTAAPPARIILPILSTNERTQNVLNTFYIFNFQ
uniref:Uncharacterized protein n=1 Tax=Anabas testudineus TaxID=64144 RepID=A0A3Q1H6G5_ANATE